MLNRIQDRTSSRKFIFQNLICAIVYFSHNNLREFNRKVREYYECPSIDKRKTTQLIAMVIYIQAIKRKHLEAISTIISSLPKVLLMTNGSIEITFEHILFISAFLNIKLTGLETRPFVHTEGKREKFWI